MVFWKRSPLSFKNSVTLRPTSLVRSSRVRGVVDAVLDQLALPVELALLRSVTLHVPIDMNLDDFVWREKAVPDALL